MKAAMLYQAYDLRIVDVDEPEIGPEDVLIKVKITGVCGTDILAYKGLDPFLSFPVILGHEFSGVITKVGGKVCSHKPGERVIAQPSWGCGHCYLCRAGKSNLCQRGVHMGRDLNGSFAQYVAVPAKQVYQLPKNVSFEDAQSIVTLACAVRVVKLAEVTIGDTVVITGPGHAGLLLSQVAEVAGAEQVIVAGTRDSRLKLAADLGADLTINIQKEDLVKAVKDFTHGLGADVVIEASGNQLAVKQSIEMVKPGGTIVIFGIAKETVDNLKILQFYVKELTMLGSRGGFGEYKSAIKLLSLNKVKVRPLITHKLSLEETERALEIADKRLEDALRVVVKS